MHLLLIWEYVINCESINQWYKPFSFSLGEFVRATGSEEGEDLTRHR